MAEQKTAIAVFDFDGTLTYRDTLLPFLFFTHGTRAAIKLLTLFPNFVRYALKMKSRQATKESIITEFYAGLPIFEVERQCRAYAETKLDKKIKPEARDRLHWHLSQGHRIVVVSASLNHYIIPWAKSLGIKDVISSQLEVTPDGFVTGKLKGLNCWGPEKSRRLTELLGNPKDFSIYAYGDSRGDQELLAMADYSFFRTFQERCCSCH